MCAPPPRTVCWFAPSKDGADAAGSCVRTLPGSGGNVVRLPRPSSVPARWWRDPASGSSKDALLGTKRVHVNPSPGLLMASALVNALGTKTLAGTQTW